MQYKTVLFLCRHITLIQGQSFGMPMQKSSRRLDLSQTTMCNATCLSEMQPLSLGSIVGTQFLGTNACNYSSKLDTYPILSTYSIEKFVYVNLRTFDMHILHEGIDTHSKE